MYLMFFDDGAVLRSEGLREEDMEGLWGDVDSGRILIIDISDIEKPMRYEGGEWVPVEEA